MSAKDMAKSQRMLLYYCNPFSFPIADYVDHAHVRLRLTTREKALTLQCMIGILQ
jgi:hypothetical protein